MVLLPHLKGSGCPLSWMMIDSQLRTLALAACGVALLVLGVICLIVLSVCWVPTPTCFGRR